MAAVLLALFAGRVALTYCVFNDTFDEGVHIAAGLEILQRKAYTFEAQHPPLGRLVVAVLPYYFGGLRLGRQIQLWGHGPWARGDLWFFWKTLALARAGNLLFAAILLYFVYRWSSMLFGGWAAVAACLLAACCPNLLAHAGLATLDLGAAATVLMAAYFFWRWSREPGWRYCLASAVAFSLAILVKFSALVFLPPLGAIYFLTARWTRAESLRPVALIKRLGRVGAFGLVCFFVLWAGYGFEVGAVLPPGHRFAGGYDFGPTGRRPNVVLHNIVSRTLPAHLLLEGVMEVANHNAGGHASFLLGHVSARGWWYYFPVAVAVKTTLPMLLLVALGIAAAGRKAIGPLLAVVVIVGVSLPASINIGIRHVLAIYPFFAILASAAFVTGRRALTVTALALAAWHAGESIAAHPDYLAYFNELARGREERILVDSNLDWGQDLARLGEYMRDHHIDSVRLRYFGASNPHKLGVAGTPLAGEDRSPGWIAVSVTSLMMDGDLLWLRERPPAARVGQSIRLYYLGPEAAGSRP